MIDYLRVPFGYKATVLPSRRHTKTHKIWLRSEILVEVPSLSRQEVVEALELPERHFVSGWEVRIQGDRRILTFEQRLYSQLRIRGEPVDLKGATAAFSESVAAGSSKADPVDLSYPERAQFPIAMETAWSFRNTPLMVRSLGGHGLCEGWPAPFIVSSDLQDQEMRAATRLAKAFILVDGIVYMERPEPVLHLRRVRRNLRRLVVETYPWTEGAGEFFRLDRAREAQAWAARRRLQIAPDTLDSPAEVLRPEILKRQDAVEVAKHALQEWATLRDDIIGSPLQAQREVELLDQLLDAREALDLNAATVVMKAMRSLDGLTGKAEAWRSARRLDARWRAEGYISEPDLFSDHLAELTPDDLAALEGAYSNLDLEPS